MSSKIQNSGDFIFLHACDLNFSARKLYPEAKNQRSRALMLAIALSAAMTR